ncbi:MAG: hypothetical protein JST30_09100 [Armatimonadetes bacterium]|nr:hypothetical protein [Armatimonadota bacterium]
MKSKVVSLAPDDAVWTCETDFEGMYGLVSDPHSWVAAHGGLKLATPYTILKSPAKGAMSTSVLLEANVHVEDGVRNVAFIRAYVDDVKAQGEYSDVLSNGLKATRFTSLWDIVRSELGSLDMTVKYSRVTTPQKVSVHLELDVPAKIANFITALTFEPSNFGTWLQGNTVKNWFETLPRGIDIPLVRATGTREIFTSNVGPMTITISGWSSSPPCPYPKVLVACNGTVGTYVGDPESQDTTVDADETLIKWYCAVP